MALGSNDAQAAKGFDLLVFQCPFLTQADDFYFFCSVVKHLVGLHGFNTFFNVAAQHNVSPPPGHVGGNSYHFGSACLGHNVRLTGMLFGIEHLVRQVFFNQ